MSDTIEKFRERQRAKKQWKGDHKPPTSSTVWPELETSPEADNRLKIIRYYDIVTGNLKRADEALNFFRVVVENAHKHTTAIGNLTILTQETPGLQTLYGGVHVDCSQIRKYLEEVLAINKAKKNKWFMYSPEARNQFGDVKITEAKQWTEADEDIANLTLLVRRFANAENQLANIMQGFTTRGIMISKLVSIREAGLEEVWVDPTKETTNE